MAVEHPTCPVLPSSHADFPKACGGLVVTSFRDGEMSAAIYR